MFSIILKNQHVKAPVGWHPQERASRVDLWISVTAELKSIHIYDELHKTLDYADLIKTVITESSKERRLLETLAADISNSLQKLYPGVMGKLSIEIRKKNVPVNGFAAEYAGIHFSQTFE